MLQVGFFGELRLWPLSISVALQLIFFFLIYQFISYCLYNFRQIHIRERRIEISLLLNTNCSIISTLFAAWYFWPGPFWTRLLNPFEPIISWSTYFLYAIDWSVSNIVFDVIIYML